MKIRCKKNGGISLTSGAIYEVIGIEYGWYRIIDDTDEDYLYSPETFDIVEGGPEDLDPSKIIE